MANHVKYPRTLHLPWSEGISSDDKVLESTDCFKGKKIVVTEKMDGECTTFYRDHIYARSIDSGPHWSRHWVKSFWAGIKNEIPEGWRICGENLYATHSIEYKDLLSYFYAFSIWDNENICRPWKETINFLSDLGIEDAPVMWYGEFDEFEKIYPEMWKHYDPKTCEGYVIRVADAFPFDQFQSSVAKFVRKGHVQTNEHWMYSSDKKINMLQE